MYTNDLLESNRYGFNIKQVTYQEPMKMPEMHYHRFYEILHVTQNSRILIMNNQKYQLDRHHIAIIPPFVPHMTISGDSMPETRILLDASWEFLCNNPICTDLLSSSLSGHPIAECSLSTDRILAIEQELLLRCDTISSKRNQQAILIYLSELFLLLAEQNPGNTSEKKSVEILKFIEAHFTEKITLEQLEKTFYLSRFTISRKIKAYTGMSLPQYLNTIRIIHAKKTLRQGVGVTETALDCGFGSISDFDRVFRAETGITPSEYKKTITEYPQA